MLLCNGCLNRLSGGGGGVIQKMMDDNASSFERISFDKPIKLFKIHILWIFHLLKGFTEYPKEDIFSTRDLRKVSTRWHKRIERGRRIVCEQPLSN